MCSQHYLFLKKKKIFPQISPPYTIKEFLYIQYLRHNVEAPTPTSVSLPNTIFISIGIAFIFTIYILIYTPSL